MHNNDTTSSKIVDQQPISETTSSQATHSKTNLTTNVAKQNNKSSKNDKQPENYKPIQLTSRPNFEGFMGRCRSVDEFEKLNRIGEGTYGTVCKFKKCLTI